jgi:iron(III) transport system substrate-binding protein
MLPTLLTAFLSWGFVATSDGAQTKPTVDSIMQGAKKEGKVSWASNLVDDEVQELNKAFQKEFPFIKKVEYARMRGTEENERMLSEMQAGIFSSDLVHIGEELIPRYQSLGYLFASIDWNGLFKVDPRMIHPKGFGVAVGNTPVGLVYHKTKIPKESVPQQWSDCLNPLFKGKLALEVRPQHFLSLMAGKGEEWTVDFAKKLAANKPRWTSSATAAITMVTAGEILIVCPTSHASWYRQASRTPNYPAAWTFPEGPVMASRALLLSPMKGAPNSNAAVLLAGWIATKGLPILDTGRESIFHSGTRLGKEFKRLGREISVTDWEDVAEADKRVTKILQIWGFPKAEK